MDGRKPVLLVVEDEPDLLDLYTQGLTMAGAEILPAENGEEAWEIFNKDPKRVDLVLSDIFMPGMNGVQLMSKIKSHTETIPVILITGYAHLHTLIEESNYEPNAFLEKPFNLPNLFEEIKKLLPTDTKFMN